MRLLLLLLAISVPAVPAAAAPSPALPSAEWAAEWSAQRLDAVMAFYAPDAVFHPGSSSAWSGTASIRKNFADTLAKVHADLHLSSVKTGASGDLAFDSGTYDETMVTTAEKTKPLHASGDYLFLFRRDGKGRWKILEQVWTAFGPQKL